MRLRLALVLCVLCLVLASAVADGGSKGKKSDGKGGKSGDKGGKGGKSDGKGGSGEKRFKKCEKQSGLVTVSKAGQSFFSEAPEGCSVSSIAFSSATTASNFVDTVFTISYKKVTTQKQTACKTRITKFVTVTETSSISCSDQETLCGLACYFDESSKKRYIAFACCEYSNAAQNDASEKQETKTISLRATKSISSTVRSLSSLIKSVKISSMTSESVTVTVTYCSLHYEKEARFTESTTKEEYKSSSSSSSSNSSDSSSSSSSSNKSSSSKSSSSSSKNSQSGSSSNQNSQSGGSSNQNSQSESSNSQQSSESGGFLKKLANKLLNLFHRKTESNSGSSTSEQKSLISKISQSKSESSSTTITEERISSFKSVKESQKTEVGKSYKYIAKKGYCISNMIASVEKTSSGKTDIVYTFTESKIVQNSSQSQKAVKTRYTKFCKSSEMSQISCSSEESLCGILSDYNEQDGRLYALVCCEYSNAKAGKTETVKKTVSLSESKSESFESQDSSQVIKSCKISSITSTSITYEITYCSYSYSEQSRFSESTTVKEYSNSQSKSSSKGCKGNGSGKKKGKDSGKKKGGSGSGSGGCSGETKGEKKDKKGSGSGGKKGKGSGSSGKKGSGSGGK